VLAMKTKALFTIEHFTKFPAILIEMDKAAEKP
jgi:hypothetical protein